jgi:hypothetical protein
MIALAARVVPEAEYRNGLTYDELIAAYESLPLRSLEFDACMADQLMSGVICARARALRHRAAARRPSGYRPSRGDLVETIERSAKARLRRQANPDQPTLFSEPA